MYRRTIAALSFGIAALSAVAASAQSLPPKGRDDSGWRHALAIYSFAPVSTSGTSTIAGRSAPIDLDLNDVLDLLDFALSGRYEAWNDNLGIIVDANYYSISANGTLPGPLGSTFGVNARQKWLGILAAYRVADGTYGAGNRRYTVDLQGGARWNSLRQQINVRTPGPVAIPTVGGDENWVEPVIGARAMWKLGGNWTAVASADFGGFGAGGNDLQIGANLGFDVQPWDNTSIVFGYRYFSMDYSDTLPGGTFAYDIKQHGPYIGVKFLLN